MVSEVGPFREVELAQDDGSRFFQKLDYMRVVDFDAFEDQASNGCIHSILMAGADIVLEQDRDSMERSRLCCSRLVKGSGIFKRSFIRANDSSNLVIHLSNASKIRLAETVVSVMRLHDPRHIIRPL